MFNKIIEKIFPKDSPIEEWYRVSFNDEEVFIEAEPPGKKAWQQSFRWNNVKNICFKAEADIVSDGIYVFTTDREESYVIPAEAKGGSEFWEEILNRGLFDSELAVEAATSTGGLYCWPDEIK